MTNDSGQFQENECTTAFFIDLGCPEGSHKFTKTSQTDFDNDKS